MENVPPYVSIVFILTAFAAVGFLLQMVKSVGLDSRPSKFLLFLLPLWILFQAALSIGGFFNDTRIFPPRIFLFGVLPALATLSVYLVFFRSSFVERLPWGLLTLVHIVRIPVELTLYWLYQSGQVPKIMTFAGANFDILSGLAALIAFAFGFPAGRPRKWLIAAFNIIGLLLLINIVSLAVLSVPTPIQQFGFEQPNRAVLFFPYSWLPALVVPIVLFSHIASLIKLAAGK